MAKHQDFEKFILVEEDASSVLQDEKVPDYSLTYTKLANYELSNSQMQSIFEMAVQGMSIISVGDWLGISRDDFASLLASNPNVSKVFLQGRAHGLKIVTKSLFQLIEIKSLDAIKYYMDGHRKFDKHSDFTIVKDENNNDIIRLLANNDPKNKQTSLQILQDALNKMDEYGKTKIY